MTYRKKLIEVALPLEAINRACVDDKNRKTGHIRNIHKWFAPMPLPAWRAVLFASVVDDPSSYLSGQAADAERARLFSIIERLLPFEAVHDSAALSAAKAEISRSLGGNIPTVVDPFCGGGSTIVEAQRLGFETFASDLNPIPVLITKALTEIPPKVRGAYSVNPASVSSGQVISRDDLEGYSADIRYYASLVRERAWKALSQYYPFADDGSVIIAWRWARTIASPNPSARGAHTPLVSDWSLSKKKGEACWIEAHPDKDGRIEYRISCSGEPPRPSTGRTNARCLLTNTAISLPYIRAEGKAGRIGCHLLASISVGNAGRAYEAPTDQQRKAAASVLKSIDAPTPLPKRALGFRVQEYGFENFEDLFTPRQLLTLQTLADCVSAVRGDILRDCEAARKQNAERPQIDDNEYADAIVTFLGLCVGRMAQSNNSLIRWGFDARNGSSKAVPAFDRHAIPMIWDFAEVNPFGGSVGDWIHQVDTALRALPLVAPTGIPSRVRQLDARLIGTVGLSNVTVATDPPYFGNIGYADLADFFYVWVRRAIRAVHPDLLATIVTPKSDELIATPFRHDGSVEKAKSYFQEGFEEVFSRIADSQRADIPASVVYAFKQEEDDDEGEVSTGWEALLEGLVRSKLSVVGTWPLRTNRSTRMIGIGTNSLASAIVVLCRVRQNDAKVISRRDFLASLRRELPEALRNLQKGNIAPVDLAQAAIGPGMAVFSRYAGVLETDGQPMSVRTALMLINQSLDEVLAEQEGEFDADTRWALAWFEQNGFNEGLYGIAEILCTAKNTSITGMVEGGIVVAKGGKVRLLKQDELSTDWDPTKDKRLTAWECTHQLIRALGSGEKKAAELLQRLGSHAEAARDLSYRLYSICEKRKWAQDALGYNALAQSWSDMRRVSDEQKTANPVQQEFL